MSTNQTWSQRSMEKLAKKSLREKRFVIKVGWPHKSMSWLEIKMYGFSTPWNQNYEPDPLKFMSSKEG